MRSVRFDSDLERRVMLAAKARGESVSEFLRQAARERADATVGSPAGAFDDVIGIVESGGGRASRTGDELTEVLVSRVESKRRQSG